MTAPKLTPDTPATRHAFNRLAREKMKLRLLADIRMDLMVCKLEGLDKLEYLDELLALVQELRKGGGAMEITKNLQTIERSLKAIKEAEFRINKLWGKTSKEAEFRIDKLWGKTSSGKLDNSLYIIESMKIREEIKKALAAVDAIKAEEFKFLKENILPLLCEQIATDDLQK